MERYLLEQRLAVRLRRVRSAVIEQGLGFLEMRDVARGLPETEAGFEPGLMPYPLLVLRKRGQGSLHVAAGQAGAMHARQEDRLGRVDRPCDRQGLLQMDDGPLGVAALPLEHPEAVSDAATAAFAPSSRRRPRASVWSCTAVSASPAAYAREAKRADTAKLSIRVSPISRAIASFIEVRPGLPVATQGEEHKPQVARGDTLSLSPPDLAGDRQVALEVHPRLLVAAEREST